MFAYIVNYFTPLTMIGCFYYSIVKAVVAHEMALKAQAKKMNVDSLRSGGDKDESAEFKIAKVAITNLNRPAAALPRPLLQHGPVDGLA